MSRPRKEGGSGCVPSRELLFSKYQPGGAGTKLQVFRKICGFTAVLSRAQDRRSRSLSRTSSHTCLLTLKPPASSISTALRPRPCTPERRENPVGPASPKPRPGACAGLRRSPRYRLRIPFPFLDGAFTRPPGTAALQLETPPPVNAMEGHGPPCPCSRNENDSARATASRRPSDRPASLRLGRKRCILVHAYHSIHDPTAIQSHDSSVRVGARVCAELCRLNHYPRLGRL
jgi:hypothetical protein